MTSDLCLKIACLYLRSSRRESTFKHLIFLKELNVGKPKLFIHFRTGDIFGKMANIKISVRVIAVVILRLTSLTYIQTSRNVEGTVKIYKITSHHLNDM